MRERFKGTGSLKNFTDNTRKTKYANGLTTEKKDILDLWDIEEMDEYDKEILFEKYSITKKDLDIYYNRIQSKDNIVDNEVEEDIEIQNNKLNLFQSKSEVNNDNFKNTITTAGISAVALGAGSFIQKSSEKNFINKRDSNNFGTGIIAGSNLAAEGSEQIQYQVKNMDILMNGEKTDPKDVEFDIQKESGKHDILKMSFNIMTSEINKYIYVIRSKDTSIEIVLNRVSEVTGYEDFKRIFDGIITSGEVIKNNGELSKVTLTAFSGSVLMDRIKHYRVFQDVTMTRKQALEIIMKDHTGKDKIQVHYDQRLDKKLGRVYIQLGMTNWEFVNYMLSTFEETGMSVTAHLKSVIFGNINITQYSCDLKYALFAQKRDGENLLYKVCGTDPYNPGEIVTFDDSSDVDYGKNKVHISRMWIEKNLINCEFETIDETKHVYPLLGNSAVMGKAVEARVVETGGENEIATVTLDFSHGLKRMAKRNSIFHEDTGKGKWNVPYTSMYSQSHTGFFTAPEPGDVVSVYFPDDDEILGYVQGCVNNPGNIRASNPNIRNYTLGGDDSAGGSPMFNFQLDSRKFDVSVTDYISLAGKNNISVNVSDGEVDISSKGMTETIEGVKTTIGKEVVQVSAGNTRIDSGGSTVVNSGSYSVVNGGANVIING